MVVSGGLYTNMSQTIGATLANVRWHMYIERLYDQ